MNREQTLLRVKELLPSSEVFPKLVREMMMKEVEGLAEKQLALLCEILSEERRRIKAIS